MFLSLSSKIVLIQDTNKKKNCTDNDTGLGVEKVPCTRVLRCLGVTCHMHFRQNDRGLSRATAVTGGWNGHRTRDSTES